MSTPLAESIWAACRSSLELDRWLGGELGEGESAELAGHVEGCARCAPIAARMKASREERLPPLRALAAELPAIANRPRRRWARVATIAIGLAAAAVALMVVKPSTGERIKGPGSGAREFSLGMYVQHGADVRRASPGERVQPGDALRFSITSDDAAYAAVLSLDPVGHASIYFPLGDRAAPVPSGSDVALPLSTRLDASLGEEHLVGLLCKTPVDLSPIRESLEHGAPRIPSDCQVARWSFVKH